MQANMSSGIIALFIWLLAGGPVNAETVKPPTPDALADSDGDGILDATDPAPFVAEASWITWNIGEMEVGWKLTATNEEVKTLLTKEENKVLSENTYVFGRKTEASTEVAIQAKTKLSSKPLENEISAEAKFQTHFAASSEVVWTDTDRNQASNLTRIVSQNRFIREVGAEFKCL